ncbi:MAG: hypothetical protein COV98_00940 [Candidatus Altarchaeum sp. CG12_big_fil_rev_8_21_14_0_65_33_22]|nr:MAG: hypothetical protein COV98_00940 [Candidatus Altarchaeum sp. CG12_big_fil_rev_8_21_14_0_65_33_22]PIV27621.1 MAG: hypothetical protein COS36_05145 [Candidatus Altarchaeum sp. CG03_land_8_20_14_0_80_32_618]PIZ31533.1 MAG: hypothetical protein COY41_02435 [Candidatus Altarchaeum sp. CG_4_10_14_0_8_um_filter_32_851]PJC14892.1 MAG: hypothetical protein CO063_02195 [Candidatus Altarchaeum sp. CG_4_9_14_0_8_um_filter_32_206]
MLKHLVIGSTPFRNIVFSYYFIEKNFGNFKDHLKFYSAFPPQLGEMVLNNEIDIAPISSILYAKHPENFLILPDFSISAKGKTGSIILVSPKSMDEISSVCLPSNSATSIAVLKIILKVKGIDAKFKISVSSGANQFNVSNVSNAFDDCDAALFIGDDGISAKEKFKNLNVIDLGEEWNKITGKGMVYALWLVNKKSAEEMSEEIKWFSELFTTSLNYAYKNFGAVIDEIKGNLKMEKVKFHILNLSYNLGKEQINALLNFYEYAKRYEIIYDVPKLNFFKI